MAAVLLTTNIVFFSWAKACGAQRPVTVRRAAAVLLDPETSVADALPVPQRKMLRDHLAQCEGCRAAAVASERVLTGLAAHTLDLDGLSIVLGSSAGVAQAAPEDVAPRLLARADDALFDAKRRGRGRVAVGR